MTRYRKWDIGRLEVRLRLPAKPVGPVYWGPLGGGWSWKLGVLGGERQVIFELFVISISFLIKAKTKP